MCESACSKSKYGRAYYIYPLVIHLNIFPGIILKFASIFCIVLLTDGRHKLNYIIALNCLLHMNEFNPHTLVLKYMGFFFLKQQGAFNNFGEDFFFPDRKGNMNNHQEWQCTYNGTWMEARRKGQRLDGLLNLCRLFFHHWDTLVNY